MRLQRDRPVEALQRTLVLPRPCGEHAAIVKRREEIRIELEGTVEARQSVLVSPARRQCDAQVGQRPRIRRRESHRLGIVRQGFIASSEGRERGGACVVSSGERCIQRERTVASLERFRFAPERVQRPGEIQQYRGAVGLELNGAREEADSVGMTAELSERDAEELQEASVIGRTT